MSKLERIAVMEGRTTFHDLREGFGGRLDGDRDADIKHALGVVAEKCGALGEHILETRYASSLSHERDIRRAFWSDVRTVRVARVYPAHVYRVAATLAIREMAGLKWTMEDLREWAWLCCVAQPALQDAIDAARNWLSTKCADARDAFLGALAPMSAPLSRHEVADLTGLTVAQLADLSKSGRFPAQRRVRGRFAGWTVEEVDAWRKAVSADAPRTA